MLTENTITKLQQMRLSAMANAFREQQLDPNMVSLSFEDRFGLLVDQVVRPKEGGVWVRFFGRPMPVSRQLSAAAHSCSGISSEMRRQRLGPFSATSRVTSRHSSVKSPYSLLPSARVPPMVMF